jgi:hypothetical protein
MVGNIIPSYQIESLEYEHFRDWCSWRIELVKVLSLRYIARIYIININNNIIIIIYFSELQYRVVMCLTPIFRQCMSLVLILSSTSIFNSISTLSH